MIRINPNLDAILRTLGAKGEVLLLARSYMTVIIIFNIFSYLSMMFTSIIRADGNPVFSSVVSISSAVLNIALDPVLIFGFGPVPQMGVRGAAIATLISQALGACVFAFYIISGNSAYKFRLSNFLPHIKTIIDIYRVGIASIVRSFAQFAAMGVINNIAASFGVVPLAIIGILVRAGRFIQMPVLGLGQGITPVISYNYGADKKNRVTETVFKIAASGSVWTTLCWLVIMIFPAQVMSFFSGDKDFLSEGAFAVRLFSLLYFTLGLRMVPGFFFQGIGKGLPVTVLTLAQFLYSSFFLFYCCPVIWDWPDSGYHFL
jgi:putative MATE family efflux protein